MKKSKVLIPALGVILLSTAASVTGTVAWFTANSVYELDAGEFQIARLDGNLACVPSAGNGTAVHAAGSAKDGGGTYAKDTITASGRLTNSSFYNNANLWFTNSTTADYIDVNGVTNWLAGAHDEDGTANDYNIYYAVSWTLTFTYTFEGDSTNVNLKLDGSECAIDKGSNETNIDQAFRIAFITSTAKAVLAKNQTSANVKSVSATSRATALVPTSNWATAGVVSSDNVVDPTLGTFTTSSASIAVTCVAWYEGSDDTNINNSLEVMESVSASLSFVAEKAA